MLLFHLRHTVNSFNTPAADDTYLLENYSFVSLQSYISFFDSYALLIVGARNYFYAALAFRTTLRKQESWIVYFSRGYAFSPFYFDVF